MWTPFLSPSHCLNHEGDSLPWFCYSNHNDRGQKSFISKVFYTLAMLQGQEATFIGTCDWLHGILSTLCISWLCGLLGLQCSCWTWTPDLYLVILQVIEDNFPWFCYCSSWWQGPTEFYSQQFLQFGNAEREGGNFSWHLVFGFVGFVNPMHQFDLWTGWITALLQDVNSGPFHLVVI